MAYFLLTGATGLLGRYLLRDLTLADLPLAVVVRPTKWESAAQRIETAMARWENELGRALVRPVVLEGDIAEPCLGLSAVDTEWVAANCGAVVHSAASLTFHAEEPTGEPWRSNVQGTRNVIELCERAGIRQYHHVSTAYVCGQRRGRILESELDVGQQPGNDYERTKLMAEKEVLASSAFDQVTIYRPSIIVGDSRTGYTTSYHGFYTPLRLVYSLLQSVPWETILQSDWLGRLQLAGNERKNLVSVEWVSAAMTWLIAHSEHHGQTYHLTNPTPATAGSMEQSMAEVLGELVRDKPPARISSGVSGDILASFRDQMTVYESYWSDDPEFDSTRTQAALPHLPCPEITHQVMDRLIRFATGANFGWPREAPIVSPFDVGAQMDRFAADDSLTFQANNNVQPLNLHVSGPGGGQWHLLMDQGRLVGAGRGVREDVGTTCYLTSSTIVELARGDLTLEGSIDSGRLVVAGNGVHTHQLAQLFRDLGTGDETRILQKAMIG